jgi:hypothetical protein
MAAHSLRYFLVFIFLMFSSQQILAFQQSKGRDYGFGDLDKFLEEQQKITKQKIKQREEANTNEAAEEPRWTKSWMLTLSGNQAAYQNWSQGGVNTLAATAATLMRIRYNGEDFSNSVRLNLQLGQTWLDGDDSRKTADLISIRNKVDYFLGTEKLSAFAELGFRTQFVKGFDDNNERVISDFMSPGYLTESIGFSFQPNDDLSVQSGLGLKQTFVRIDSLDVFYGLDEDEDFRSEGGLTISVDINKKFAETFNYTAEFSTFTNLLIPITSTDIIFRNEISGKLSNVLSTIVQFELLYDDDISDKLQLRQSIAVGLNIKLM